MKITDSTNSRFLIDTALFYARTSFFTADNGDRDDAANYYVFVIDGIRSGAAKQGELIAANWPDTVFAIGKDVIIFNSKYIWFTQTRYTQTAFTSICIFSMLYLLYAIF
jgi:hypothetical protein